MIHLNAFARKVMWENTAIQVSYKALYQSASSDHPYRYINEVFKQKYDTYGALLKVIQV